MIFLEQVVCVQRRFYQRKITDVGPLHLFHRPAVTGHPEAIQRSR